MQLPGSPSKRAAAHFAQPPVCSVCDATAAVEPAAAAAVEGGQEEATCTAGSTAMHTQLQAPCAAPLALEQLLLQLGLNAGWRSLLLRSLQDAQIASSEPADAGSIPPARAPAQSPPGAKPAPKPAPRRAVRGLAPGLSAGKRALREPEAAAVDGCPPASPRIAACGAALGIRAAGIKALHAAATPADTLGTVIHRNRHLLQQAAAAAAAAVRSLPGELSGGGGQLAVTDAELAAALVPAAVPLEQESLAALAPGAAAEDPEEVLARLECRYHGSPGSLPAVEPAPRAGAPAPSLSGALTISGPWSSLQEGGSARGDSLSACAAGAGAGAELEAEAYEDDFESVSASAAEWE